MNLSDKKPLCVNKCWFSVIRNLKKSNNAKNFVSQISVMFLFLFKISFPRYREVEAKVRKCFQCVTVMIFKIIRSDF